MGDGGLPGLEGLEQSPPPAVVSADVIYHSVFPNLKIGETAEELLQ